MKTLGLILGLCISGLITESLHAQGATVTLTIENIGSAEGQVLASLHSAETFLTGPGLQNARAEASPGQVKITFEDVAPGTYAISGMHDLNGNYQMDFGADGMPGEPWAMSGKPSQQGPPSFNLSKFEVTGENLHLSLRFQ